MPQVTTFPLAGSHYPLLDKLKELHFRMNMFVAIGIPLYLAKSMQAVHGIHTWENKKAKLKGCNAVRKGLYMPKLTPAQSCN